MPFTIATFVGCEPIGCVTRLVYTFVRTSCLCFPLLRSKKNLGTIPLTNAWARYFWITLAFIVESSPTTSSTMIMASFCEILTLTFVIAYGSYQRFYCSNLLLNAQKKFGLQLLVLQQSKLTSLIIMVETAWPSCPCLFSSFLYTTFGVLHLHGVVGFLEQHWALLCVFSFVYSTTLYTKKKLNTNELECKWTQKHKHKNLIQNCIGPINICKSL